LLWWRADEGEALFKVKAPHRDTIVLNNGFARFVS
jgi:hypothetical protein